MMMIKLLTRLVFPKRLFFFFYAKTSDTSHCVCVFFFFTPPYTRQKKKSLKHTSYPHQDFNLLFLKHFLHHLYPIFFFLHLHSYTHLTTFFLKIERRPSIHPSIISSICIHAFPQQPFSSHEYELSFLCKIIFFSFLFL